MQSSDISVYRRCFSIQKRWQHWTDRKWVYKVSVKNDWMRGCSDHWRSEGDQWGPGYWPRSCRGCEAKTCITCEKEATYERFSVLWRLKRWVKDSECFPSIISICWKKLMLLRFALIFVTKYFHKVKNFTEINDQNLSNTVDLQSVILFCSVWLIRTYMQRIRHKI